MSKDNEIVHHDHWEEVHTARPKMRVPSLLTVSTKNLQDVLKKHIAKDMKVVEIGFAPGKQLSYVAKKYGANVTGLDYSQRGIDTAKELFATIGIKADLRCEDVFNNTLPSDSYDVVYSAGVIEHFEDPTEIVWQHVRLLKKGGKAVILIPNYGGVYGRLQRDYDPENLSIHNLRIMSKESLLALAKNMQVEKAITYATGGINPGLVSLHRKLPRIVARLIDQALNMVGVFQPFKIESLCPLLVLEIRK
jgi:2-polyprenyl-3-methyl-5-hydroxy-6-metoxy-1,4-benzoquinol methylase